MRHGLNSLIALWVVMFISCNNAQTNPPQPAISDPQTLTKSVKKPPSTFSDTFIVNKPAAVFYHPDSIQLAKIKVQTDSMAFEGSMHDFFYQMRNARLVIKENWPELPIIECRNYRVILFILADKSRLFIDLDTKPDAYGLFVFDAIKPPLFADMTNIETSFSFYLNE